VARSGAQLARSRHRLVGAMTFLRGDSYATELSGCRFDGQLQSIHHVEQVTIFARFRDLYPESSKDWGPGVKFELGPPIHPSNVVRSGKLRDCRVWADIGGCPGRRGIS
jgi:hypothetical protein